MRSVARVIWSVCAGEGPVEGGQRGGAPRRAERAVPRWRGARRRARSARPGGAVHRRRFAPQCRRRAAGGRGRSGRPRCARCRGSAGPACRWRTAGSRLPPTGTWVKSWLRVTAARAGLPVSPASRVSRKVPEGCQPDRRVHHDAPGIGSGTRSRSGRRSSAGEQLLGAEHRVARLGGEAGARALLSAAAAGRRWPWPRSSVKGWAKV